MYGSATQQAIKYGSIEFYIIRRFCNSVRRYTRLGLGYKEILNLKMYADKIAWHGRVAREIFGLIPWRVEDVRLGNFISYASFRGGF